MTGVHEFDRKSIHEIEKMTIYDKQAYISQLREYYVKLPFDKTKLLRCERIHKILVHIIGRVILWGIKIDVRGNEKFPINQNVVFVCNHKRAFDIPLMHIVLKNRMPHFLIKKECESGMWGGILRNIGTIFVQRENKKSCEEAISMLIHNLVHGEDVVIFPEGTRNRTQQLLLPLKKGAVYVSQVSQKPVVPIAIKKYGRKYVVNIGNKIEFETKESVREGTMRLKHILEGLLLEI